MNGRKLMYVKWLDHFDNASWHRADAVDLTPWEVESIGWVTAENDDAIALSTGLIKRPVGDQSGYTMTILKATIVESYEVVF